MEILQGCECHYEGTEDCGFKHAEYVTGSIISSCHEIEGYNETWECKICGRIFKMPTEFKIINDEINHIERLWDKGETRIPTIYQYEINFNGSN